MLRVFAKIHVPKNYNTFNQTFNFGISNQQFGTEKSKESSTSKSQSHFCKHQEAFKNLKSSINVNQSQDKLKKYAVKNSFEGFKQKLYENFKFRKNPSNTAENNNDSGIKAPYDFLKSATAQQEIHKTETEASKLNKVAKEEKVTTESKKISFKESLASLSESAPALGKVVEYIRDSWDQTFPKDKFMIKAADVRKKAKEVMERERQEMPNYTEEELEQMQGQIPQWKRTALIEITGGMREDTSKRRRIINSIKQQVKQTTLAKQIYQSEHYQEYQEVKREMAQFKEDWKDHMSQSQNPAVMASMTIYSKVTSESNTARAIKEMRSRMPGFSIYELERDAKGVFCQIYDAFLEGNLSFIEKTCGESALVYFRTLLKKREVDGVFPKYTYLWDADVADLIGGKIPTERNHPSFSFTIRVQEIHCNINKKTNKVVDGREDKVIQQRFNFVLSMHENPDLEISGHPWELVEILPVEAVHMLA